MKRFPKLDQNKSYGNKLAFLFFQFVLKNIGLKCGYLILFLVVPYYVVFRPSIYQRTKPYLQRRFPHDNFGHRYLRLFKYIFVFGQYLVDQLYFGFMGESMVELEFEREAEVLQQLEREPMIFIMSHVGFWEISMAGAVRFDKKLNVLVNQGFDKDKRKSFYDLKEKKFNLINVADDYGGMIEATNALLRGEVVGVTGDRAEQWRSKTATFLGAPAKFPVIAQQLAVATGTKVFAFFTSKEGKFKLRYHCQDISSEILADTSLSKEEKVQKILENYVAELEKHLQKHPYLWFNFFDFWKQ